MLFKMKNLYSSFIVIIMMSLITSCGYSMRGSLNLPASLEKISVYSDSYSDLVNSINSTLQNSGITVTSSNSKHLYRIVVISEELNRRQLSMNITGRVNEYELIYEVKYEINSPNEKNLSDSIILYRDYSFDENNVMGNSDREDDIHKEMISTASTLIFNKLRAVAD
jgi:LPS-assembly lipoprotein